MGEQDARFRWSPDDGAGGDRLTSSALLTASACAADLLDILDKSVGRLVGPALRPKQAAALIVVDTSGAEPRILMGRRNPELAFMGGFFVFPGGRLEASDRRMRPLSDLPESASPRLRPLALAAVRETFEETGYLIGARAEARAPPGAWSDFVGHGVAPSLQGLKLVARAVTPPGHIRRFDTAFFRVDAADIAHRAPRVFCADDELTDVDWIPASALRSSAIAAITYVIAIEALRDNPDGVPCYTCPNGRWRRISAP